MLPIQGVWVQYLVGELRSHLLCGMAKLKKKKNCMGRKTQAKRSEIQRSQEVEELVGTPAEFLSSVTGKQHLLLSHCISVRLNGLILVEIVTGVSEVQWATFLMASE